MSVADRTISVAGLPVANDRPFTLFGGMNVLESRDLAMQVAESYVRVCEKLDIPYAVSYTHLTLPTIYSV